MDFAFEPVLASGWDTSLDTWILSCLTVAALPLAVALLVVAAAAAIEPRTLGRRFWCALSRREAEVRFAARGLLSAPCDVVSCSIFEPGSAIACRRRCL